MTQVQWLKTTILQELNTTKDCFQLRPYLVQFKEAGGRQRDAYTVLEELRTAFEGTETKEEKILGLLDFVTGHCQKNFLVWVE